jgi:hypothetical protein
VNFTESGMRILQFLVMKLQAFFFFCCFAFSNLSMFDGDLAQSKASPGRGFTLQDLRLDHDKHFTLLLCSITSSGTS